MNIVPIEKRNCDSLLEELKGKTFFAISIDSGIYEVHFPDNLLPSEIVYGLEVAREILMKSVNAEAEIRNL